jgi:hypothetical protein
MKKIILSITLIIALVLNIKIETFHDFSNKLLSFIHITKKCYKPNEENFLEIY